MKSVERLVKEHDLIERGLYLLEKSVVLIEAMLFSPSPPVSKTWKFSECPQMSGESCWLVTTHSGMTDHLSAV